ncbi:hypothetical protein [Halovenus salina]|uniref:Uncharacterized protein n=1 Tax=Halovenus salina TaxID=1510225 RepID=A0ABD5VXG9_9EURY|nr:hypothetical protein [Halovenus salina]
MEESVNLGLINRYFRREKRLTGETRVAAVTVLCRFECRFIAAEPLDDCSCADLPASNDALLTEFEELLLDGFTGTLQLLTYLLRGRDW